MRVAGHMCAAGLLLAAAACKGSGEPPTTGAAADTADQVLYGFDHNVTLDGVFRARLTADTAFFYQGTQTAMLYGPVVRFYTPTGELSSTVTAIDGTYGRINTSKGTGSRRIPTSPTWRRRTRGAGAWVRWR
jgi:hypothetical protein